MHSLRERAGIEYLGQYRSKGKEQRLARALHTLSQAVEVPAVDYHLHAAVQKLLESRLAVAEENRSVTSDQWVEKALVAYGCPIHPTTANGPVANKKRAGCTCVQRRRRLEVRTSGRATRRNNYGDANRSTDTDENGEATEVVVQPRAGSTDRARLATDGSWDIDGRGSFPGYSSRVQVGRDRGPDQTAAHELAIRSVYSASGSVEGRRKPIPFAEVVERHIHARSYAGLPHLDFNDVAKDAASRLVDRIADGSRGFDPYLFGRRVQPGISGPKTRLVWMAPLSTTIVGLSFSKPVQEALARNRPYIWGLRHHEEGSILAEMNGRYRYVYCLDWSQFDSSVPASLINDMFRVIRTMLDLTESEDKLFWRYVNDFIHTRIVLPDGGVYQVHRGVPSGSAFTSLIDSMVNVYLVNYIWVRLTGHTLSHKQVLVMGDDAVVGTDEHLELAEIARAADECGFKLNVNKSVVVSTSEEGSGIHFIGHSWTHGRARRPHRELLQRMAFPERHAEQSRERSLKRLAGYAFSSVDGLIILLQLYESESVVTSVCMFLDDLRAVAGDEVLRAYDLPGDLRRRVMVEGEPMPDIKKRSGPHLMLFASVF